MTSEVRAKIMGIDLTDIKSEKKKLRKGSVSLAEANPELAKEWHPTKNGDLTPYDVSYGSQRKAWWLGQCGHEWEARIGNRSMGRKCPLCAHQLILPGINDLETLRPDIAGEWHPIKNGDLKPCDVNKYSRQMVWWKCAFGHEWKAIIANRTGDRGTGCPYCQKNKGTSYNELALFYYISQIYADAVNRSKIQGKEVDIAIPQLNIAIEYDGELWHTEERAGKDIEKYHHLKQAGYNLIRIREPQCPKLHNYEGIVIQMEKRSSIAVINEMITKVLQHLQTIDSCAAIPDVDIKRDSASIATCISEQVYRRSLSGRYPELVKEWDNDKNGDLLPSVVPARGRREVWWICEKGHSYKATLHRRTGGTGCPTCSRRITTPQNSIAVDVESQRPDLLKFWDYEKNGALLPSQVHFRSKTKVWLRCACGESFQAPIKSTFGRCSKCARQLGTQKRLIVGVNDFASTHPDMAALWHPNKNEKTAQEVRPGTRGLWWWICKNGHEYQRTIPDQNTLRLCPVCTSNGQL